jgi:ATP-dependent RNA helicase RhlE
MPKDIVEISQTLLGNKFERITIKPDQATAEKVEQAVYKVSKKNKGVLLEDILNEKGQVSTLVFSRTKHGANKIVKVLNRSGFKAEAIHGNKSQASRQKSLKAFKDGKIHILVATDIAARGIDVDDLALVINYDLPNIPETYVHRIGRTGRAAASGIALSFCNGEERAYLRDIEKLIKQKVPVITEHSYVDNEPEPSSKDIKASKANNSRGRSQGRSSRDDRNATKKKRPNKSRNDNRSDRSNDKKDDRPRREDISRSKPQGERSANRNNSEQKPRDGKPNNKRRNNRNDKPREEIQDQNSRSSQSNNPSNRSGNNNPRNKKTKDGVSKTERKFREGQKKSSDYKGKYRPKGTMWELD